MLHCLFLHIPKTGGTSINDWLDRFPEIAVARVVAPRDGTLRTAQIASQKVVVSGHFRWAAIKGSMPPVVVTALRHPVDRVLSLYGFYRHDAGALNNPDVQAARAMSLEAFIEAYAERWFSDVRNTATQMLTGEHAPEDHPERALGSALANLESCAVAGVTERLDEFAERLAQVLELDPERCRSEHVPRSRQTSRRQQRDEMGADLLRRIEDLNALDMVLYERCRTLAETWDGGSRRVMVRSAAVVEHQASAAVAAPTAGWGRIQHAAIRLLAQDRPWFQVGDRVRLEVIWQADHTRPVIIGFTCHDHLGNLVFGINDLGRVPVRQDGEGVDGFVFPLMMTPGRYRFRVAMHDDQNVYTDDRTLCIEIEPSSADACEGAFRLPVEVTRWQPAPLVATVRPVLRVLAARTHAHAPGGTWFSVLIRNVSGQALDPVQADAVRIGYRILSADGQQPLLAEGERIRLASGMPTDGIQECLAWVAVPEAVPADRLVTIRWTYVMEGSHWGDDHGAACDVLWLMP